MRHLIDKLRFKSRSAIHDDSGVAAVEFALMVPILILLVVIVYDVGIVVNDSMSVENAAVTTAQYVMKGGDPADIATEVTPELDLTDPDSYVVTAEYECECDEAAVVDCDTGSCSGVGSGYMRKFIRVETSMDHVYIFPYPGLDASIELQGGSRLQVE